MCIAPIMLNPETTVACRKCWQCRGRRIDDLVGRGIAEMNRSKLTVCMTLTYGGGDTPSAAVLDYSHFQNMIKRMLRGSKNRPRIPVRYIVAGEYGSRNNRAHWHVILFFEGPFIPKLPPPDRNHESWDWWPHGYVYLQDANYGRMRYLMKYALKDERQGNSVAYQSMSRFPPLGTEFFRARADDLVGQGLAPQDYFYSFRTVFDGKGKRKQFQLQGKSREMYLEYWVAQWRKKRPNQPMTGSPLLVERAEQIALIAESKKRRFDEVEDVRAEGNLTKTGVLVKDSDGYWTYLATNSIGGTLWLRELESLADVRAAWEGRLLSPNDLKIWTGSLIGLGNS